MRVKVGGDGWNQCVHEGGILTIEEIVPRVVDI